MCGCVAVCVAVSHVAWCSQDGKVGRKNKHVGSLAWLWGTALLNLGGHTTKVQELMRIAIDGFKADAAARQSGDGGGETVDKDTARLLAEPYAVLGSEVAKHGDRDEGIVRMLVAGWQWWLTQYSHALLWVLRGVLCLSPATANPCTGVADRCTWRCQL